MEAKKIAVVGAGVAVAAAMIDTGSVPYGRNGPMVAQPPPNGIPDRMSIDRASQFYSLGGEFVGVKVNDEDLTGRVVEFCVSGGWARVTDQPKGTRLTYQQVKDAPKVYGTVEVYWAREPNRQVRRQLARVR